MVWRTTSCIIDEQRTDFEGGMRIGLVALGCQCLRLIRPSDFMSALLHNQLLFQPLAAGSANPDLAFPYFVKPPKQTENWRVT